MYLFMKLHEKFKTAPEYKKEPLQMIEDLATEDNSEKDLSDKELITKQAILYVDSLLSQYDSKYYDEKIS